MRTSGLVVALICSCASAPVTPTPRPATAPPVAPVLRTDGSVKPTRQHLELTVDPSAPTLRGTTRIEVTVTRPTEVIWLNATDLVVSAATIGGVAATVLPGNDDFLGLQSSAPIPSGPTVLELTFTATIDRQRSRGVYSEKEGDDLYAYTFFESTDARRAFPCFDEPGAKIPWSLALHVKQGHLARANTPITRETPEPNGFKRVEFAQTLPLPSYLVAFVVGPFELIDGGVAGRVKTPVHFIIPKGREAELGWAKEITPKVVAALETWFDHDYPYAKLDVAVVPRYWGTMEHPGIVAMGQPLTLIRPDQLTRERRQGYANILAHELAHYWFGDLVTTAWWNDTWLNEALGEWMDLIITDAVAPEWHLGDQKRVDASVAAMAADELLATPPIRLPVETREAINSAFDAEITYFKGSSLMRMFEASVGKERWRAFMQKWIRTHENGNATADDFLALARAELGADVAEGLSSFLTQPGVPLVEAKVVCAQAQPGLQLRQQRSLPAGVTDPSPKTWSFPVCVRAGDAATSERLCTTLKTEQTFVPLARCPTWVVLNDDATGLYRSAIDLSFATAVFTPSSPIAARAKLSVAERLMLLSDLQAAVSRDELSIDRLLGLVSLIQQDPDDRVAREALDAAFIRTDALDDAAYERYLRFLRQVTAPQAGKLGWVRAPNDSDDRQALRRRALGSAAYARDPAVTQGAIARFEPWLKDRAASGLSDDLVSVVLSTAARTGDARRFDALLEAARHARDRTERDRLIGTLGSFVDPTLSSRARDLVTGAEFDLRESVGIIYLQLNQRETRAATWVWLEANLDSLLKRMRSDEASGFLGFIASAFCDAPRRAEAEHLVAPHAKTIDGAPIAVARGLEDADQCIAQHTRTWPALKRFLASVK